MNQNLALVTTDTPAPASEFTQADRDTFKRYHADLDDGKYFKLYDASSHYPRIISRDDLNDPLPLSWLLGDFNDWLAETYTKRPSRMPTEAYLAQPLLCVTGTRFLPNGPALIRAKHSRHRYINIYQRYEPTHARTDVSPLFLQFFERLMPDPDERHTVVQWLSHIFQKPQERPSWHVMFSSEPGVGKGFLVQNILHPLLHHTSVVSSFTKVLSQFSTIVEDSLVCLLDDCKAKNEDTQIKLKSLLSEARAFVEHKGLQGSMVNTYTRFVLASNEEQPIPLKDPLERRWFVPMPLVHKFNKEETQAFLQTLDDWLSVPGSLCSVYNYFMAYDLTGFNPKHVRQTKTLLAIIGASKSPYAQILNDYIEDHKIFTYSALMTEFDNLKVPRPTPAHMEHLFSEVRYKRGRPRINQQQITLYHPIGMTTKEIEEEMERIANEPPSF